MPATQNSSSGSREERSSHFRSSASDAGASTSMNANADGGARGGGVPSISISVSSAASAGKSGAAGANAAKSQAAAAAAQQATSLAPPGANHPPPAPLLKTKAPSVNAIPTIRRDRRASSSHFFLTANRELVKLAPLKARCVALRSGALCWPPLLSSLLTRALTCTRTHFYKYASRVESRRDAPLRALIVCSSHVSALDSSAPLILTYSIPRICLLFSFSPSPPLFSSISDSDSDYVAFSSTRTFSASENPFHWNGVRRVENVRVADYWGPIGGALQLWPTSSSRRCSDGSGS